MRLVTGTVLALALVLALAGSAGARPWTILYYVVVDERTSQFELDAINKVPKAITAPDAVAAVLQWDTHKDPAGRFVAQNGGWKTTGEKIPDNMGDPVNFFNFLDWGMKTYPADHYMVFIGGHGSGFEDTWGPGSTADRAYPTPWFREQLQRRLQETDRPRGSATFDGRDAEGGKGTAYDYDDKDCLTLQEIRVVLEEVQKRHLGGRKLDVLAYSSCWQMNLESLFEHQDCARYMIGCETVSYSGSQLFYGFLDDLCANPAAETRTFCDVIIKDYINSAQSAGTIAWIDSDGLPAILMAFDRVAAELLRVNRHPKAHNVDGGNFQAVLWTDADYHKGNERFADLTSLTENVLSSRVGFRPTGYLQQAARDLRAALGKNMNSWHREPYSGFKSYCISVYLPTQAADLQKYRNHLSQLRIAQETHWDDYLYLRRDAGFSNEASLLEDLAGLASRARRLTELEGLLPTLAEGSAERVLGQREHGYLALLQDHNVQLLTDEARFEVEEEDASGLADLAAAAEKLSAGDRPVAAELTRDLVAFVSMAIRTVRHADPAKAEAALRSLERFKAALASTAADPAPGGVIRQPGE